MANAVLDRPNGRWFRCAFLLIALGAVSGFAMGAHAQEVLNPASLDLLAALSSQTISPVLPGAPSFQVAALPESSDLFGGEEIVSSSSSTAFPLGMGVDWVEGVQTPAAPQTQTPAGPQKKGEYTDVDANGNPIPVDRHQTRRIGGIIPNYRAVSGGAVAHPPGWKYNFSVATHQAFDYSGFIFLGITSISAEGLNEHPPFGKGVGGFWTYTWHGFLDKTDGTYIQAWFLPSLLHEDTRYYALGDQYSVKRRIIHVIDRQVITKSYSGHDTINIAGFGGKVLTQYISTFYYPASSATFGKLSEKFSFSVARDIGFTALREFYPDYLGYKQRKQQRKAAALAARDQAGVAGSTPQMQATPVPGTPQQ